MYPNDDERNEIAVNGEQPDTGQIEIPAVESSDAEAPTVEAPVYEATVSEATVTETPAVELPAVEGRSIHEDAAEPMVFNSRSAAGAEDNSVYTMPPIPEYTAPPVVPDYSTAQPPPENTIPPVYPSQPDQTYPRYPSYSNQQPSNAGWNTYSPGMYANQPAPRDRNAERAAANIQKSQKTRAGAFFRAACLILVCTLLSAAATYFVMDYRFDRGDFTPEPPTVILGGTRPTPSEYLPDSSVPAKTAGATDGYISAQEIYDIALTQVVGISVTPSDSQQFAGVQGVPSVTGSGFIVSADGYILTNYHVIELAHSMNLPIDIIMHDSSSYKAKIIGFDAPNDVALLKIEVTGLNPAAFGNSDELRVGQAVYAVGNPFGDLVYTMTDGIVSALDRIVSLEGKSISTFQFSAAVNSGNSGGPVYNAYGEVIGIVTAKLIRGSVEGIGFAIPINDARDIAFALIDHGYISDRPLLGVTVRTMTEDQVRRHTAAFGVLVRDVSPGSAADNAGIKVNDIITAIEDEPVDSLESLRFALRQFRAGDTATITVWRRGESSDETIKLEITFDEDMGAGKPDQPATTLPEHPDPYE